METDVVTLRRKPLADGGQAPPNYYYVYVNQQQFGITTSCDEAFRALARYVHDGILHKDFKTGEILFNKYGESRWKSKIIYSISAIDEINKN